MSKYKEEALKSLKNSEFILGNKTLEVRNASIVYHNFAGNPDDWGNTARTFNLVVTPEIADKLVEKGFKVRQTPVNKEDPESPIILHISVKLSLESKWPPLIKLYPICDGIRKKPILLTGNKVDILDRVNFESIDVKINLYESAKFKGKVTGYLQELRGIQIVESDFGGKYDDWDEDETDYGEPED